MLPSVNKDFTYLLILVQSLPPPQSLLLRFLNRDARKLGMSAKHEQGLAHPASPNRGGATGDEAGFQSHCCVVMFYIIMYYIIMHYTMHYIMHCVIMD